MAKAKEDGSIDKELTSIKHRDTSSLEPLHKEFSKLDINSKDLDLDEAITEIKAARKLYPLDDKLKTVEMGLDHKRANQAYNSSKD